MAQIGQNMLLVHSSFRNAKSFTLIPVSLDSPYVEAMYDPSSGILAVISKVMKKSFHMMPRLDDNGQPMRLKVPNKQTGKTVKEQRAQVETFSEFYIADKDDIDLFINMFAVNEEQFDWKQYVVDVAETKTTPKIMPGQ